MANIREIKGRIKSAGNIAKITKAMELVAASKMRKAQQKALSGKLYASKIYQMVMRLSSQVSFTDHPLLQPPQQPTGKTLVVVISTNKGLCGGLNSNLFRFLIRQFVDVNADYVTIGKKGAGFLARIDRPIMADFSDTGSFSGIVPAINQLISREFMSGSYDTIELVYNEFISAIKQEPVRKTILPLSLGVSNHDTDDAPALEYLVEPDPKTVFDELLPHYLENQIRDAVLQAEASEHSARMMAMRNATDNANSLISDLTLAYNKARQEKITYEITDMVTARLALE